MACRKTFQEKLKNVSGQNLKIKVLQFVYKIERMQEIPRRIELYSNQTVQKKTSRNSGLHCLTILPLVVGRDIIGYES